MLGGMNNLEIKWPELIINNVGINVGISVFIVRLKVVRPFMIDRPDPSPIISTLAATDIMSDCPAIIGKLEKAASRGKIEMIKKSLKVKN